MKFNPAFLGSGWLLVFAVFSAFSTALVRTTRGDFCCPDLLFAEYWFVTVMCAVLMCRKGISFLSPHWRSQAMRIALGVFCSGCALYMRQELPVGLAQTFIFSTPVFIVAGLVLLDIFRGRIGWSGFFYLIAAVGSAAVVAKVLVPASSCLSPPALAAGLSFGVASAVATLCLKYLGDRGEPTLRSVFYFGVGCCLVGSLGLAAGNPADIWRMATTPVLWLLALSTAVCQLTKVYSWGHYSPWLNSMLLFLGIPTALLMGWLFYDEELTEAELWLIAFVAGMTLSCAWCRSWWRRMTRSR